MLRCVLFIITVLVLGLLAGKPRFKGWLEGVRTGACHRSIIWVQVGPQARIRDPDTSMGEELEHYWPVAKIV